MQKLNKKASVLLWSIFLSMTVLIAFISINQQVLNNLKENSNKLISTNEYNLAPNEYIVSESENYEKIGLKKGETFEINANSSPNEIKIIEGSPVKVNGEIVLTGAKINGEKITIESLGGYSNIELIAKDKFVKNYKKDKIVKKVGNSTFTKKVIIKPN